MTKVKKEIIAETIDSEAIIENEIVVTTTKSASIKALDMSGGKVQIKTEGYANGETVNVTVNGKTQDVEISNGLAIFCSNFSFSQYPSISIND